MHEEGKYNWKTVFQSYQLFMRIMVFDFFSRAFNTEEYHYDPNKTKEPVFRKKLKEKLGRHACHTLPRRYMLSYKS